MTRNQGKKNSQGIHVWAARLLTSVSLLFLSVVVGSVILHLAKPTRFPAPEALGVEALAGIAVITIFATYFPWSKISFGGVEIERILYQQAKEHAEDLRVVLSETDAGAPKLESGYADITVEHHSVEGTVDGALIASQDLKIVENFLSHFF